MSTKILSISVENHHQQPLPASSSTPKPLSIYPSPTTSNQGLLSPNKILSPNPKLLFSANLPRFFGFILVPPLFSLLIAFFIGFTFDYESLVNYEWTCGKAFLPSISRIINLPKERLLWNLGSLSHLSLRPILIFYHYFSCHNASKFHKSIFLFITSIALIISGFCELLFTAFLTVIGEREDGILHMVFFIAFISSCIIYFFTVTLSTRFQKSYHSNTTLQKCFKLRLFLLLSLIFLVPSIGAFFVLYWNYCIKFAYNAFALLEYITVLTIFGFHSVIMLELSHFKISLISPVKTN